MGMVILMNTNDIFNLERFLNAQSDTFERACCELRSGKKESHWMWFIFPQLKGLGYSSTAQFYGITGKEEASAYLAHYILGSRLIAALTILLDLPCSSAMDIMGQPDDLKLHSCATLFSRVALGPNVFEAILDKFFQGAPDRKTLELLHLTP
jgi:uncharacterized protein (DUF1810 family)